MGKLIVDTVKAAAAWLILAVVVFGPAFVVRSGVDRGLVAVVILTLAALFGAFGLIVKAWRRENR